MLARLSWLMLALGLVALPRFCFASPDECEENEKQVNSTKIVDSCKNNEWLYNGACVRTCPAGYYKNSSSGKCSSCHKPCSTCEGKKCTSCHNSFLENGFCVDQCSGDAKFRERSASRRVRLVNGKNSLEGRVEVYYNGSWGTVCDERWNKNAAEVACRELSLGLPIEARIVNQERFKAKKDYKDVKVWLNAITCQGYENSILDCDHKEWGNNECSHYEDVGIRCSGPDTTNQCMTSCGSGYYASGGICVECPLDCKICDGPNSCSECANMRFMEGKTCVARCKPGYYGDLKTRRCKACPLKCGTCALINSKIVCTSCPFGSFSDGHGCVKKCSKSIAFSNYVRLSGNFGNPYKGLLEVRYNGAWHTICDDYFHLEDARVFCRELGYGQPVSFVGGQYGRGTGKILTGYLGCGGNENSFIDCPQSNWFSLRSCLHYEDVGLMCEPPATSIVVQQKCVSTCGAGLHRSSENTCELCHRSCATCAGSPTNCTSCRKPYYLNGTTCSAACNKDEYADEVKRACLPCTGSCMTCSYRADNCTSCLAPLLYNGTHCVPSCPPNTLRKGYRCVTHCGLRHYGTPSGVCRVCPSNCSVCVPENSKITCKLCIVGHVLHDGQCMKACPPEHLAFPFDARYVWTRPMIRLRNIPGRSRFTGRLEVFRNGIWGSVCDDGWGYADASVACREMFLGPPKVVSYSRAASIKELNISKIWMSDVDCNGDEESLFDCRHTGGERHYCFHYEDVHIECSVPGAVSCVDKCPSRFYESAGACLPCDRSCGACVNSATNCSKCVKGYHRKPNNNSCVDHCPAGFYGSSGHCRACNASCWTCEEDPDNCTSCQAPYFLSGNRCLLNCPEGSWKRANNSEIKLVMKKGLYEGTVQVNYKGQTGLVCDRYLNLAEGHVICRQLRMGRALRVYTSFQSHENPRLIRYPYCTGNESSLYQCPTYRGRHGILRYCSFRDTVSVRCSGPDTTRKCIARCPVTDGMFVASDRVCRACDSNCLQCSMSLSNCTRCSKGDFKMRNNTCVPYCPEGTYYEKSTNFCEPCDTHSCSACFNSKDFCSACQKGLFLLSLSCKSQCTIKRYEMSGAPGIRLRSSKSTNSSAGRVEIWKDGQWAAICSGNWSVREAAVTCRQLGYGDVVKVYKEFYFVSGGRTATVLSPVKCSGKEIDLSECKRGNPCGRHVTYAAVQCSRYSPKKICVSSCGSHHFLSSGQKTCQPCSNGCANCTGTAEHCTACNSSSFLSNARCVTTCLDGSFGNLASRKCEPCDSKCKTCLNGWSNNRCLSCHSPRFLNGTECVGDCFPLYSLLYLMSPNNMNFGLENRFRSSKPKLRLYGSSGNEDKEANEGQLMVNRDGTWGYMCSLTSFQVRAVCQELGFDGGTATKDKLRRNLGLPTWNVLCQGYEVSLDQCSFTPTNYCYRQMTWLTCSKKKTDTRVCRKINDKPCGLGICHRGTQCLNGARGTALAGKSVCMHCPKGYYGNGDNCTVISLAPPTASFTSRNITLRLGQQGRLLCMGKSDRLGLYPGRYGWTKDGKYLRNSRFYLYTISRAGHEDAGWYTCKLRNSAGVVTVKFYVSVFGPPVITRADNVVKVEHTNVLLTCDVRSHDPVNITWYYNVSIIPENGTSPKPHKNGSLEIKEVLKKNAGNYTCEAWNIHGRQNETFTLTVAEEPNFAVRVDELELRKGETARFRCKPLDRGLPMKISWRKNGKALKMNDRISVNEENELVIKNVSQEDCGEYDCVGRDWQYVVTSRGALAIKGEPPCIVTPPQHLSLTVGTYARFYCKAVGSPRPVISWSKHDISWSNYGEDLASRTFAVENVSLADIGLYVCNARSGKRKSKAYAFLSVDGRHACPFMFLKPLDTNVVVGKQARFQCDGVAVPSYTIHWNRGGREIKTNRKYVISDDNRTLIIRDASSSDVGKYTCVVRSPHGKQSAVASLGVREANVAADPKLEKRDTKRPILEENKPFTLECSATDIGNQEIKWLRDTVQLDHKVEISGNDDNGNITVKKENGITRSFLSVPRPPIIYIDVFYYYCMIEAGRNEQQVSFPVTVLQEAATPKPKAVNPDVTGKVGEKVRLVCEVSYVSKISLDIHKPKLFVNWTKGSGQNDDKRKVEEYEYMNSKSVNFTSTLDVTIKASSDGGNYSCWSTLVTKTQSFQRFATFDLSIQPTRTGPEVKEVKKDAGSNVDLKCDIVGYPIKYEWTVQDGKTIDCNDSRIIINENVLSIKDIDYDDRKQYVCTGILGNGTEISQTIILRVKVGASTGKGSTNKAGIAIGVLLGFLVLSVLLYFVWRYRRDGSYPTDVFKDIKRRTVSRYTVYYTVE